MRAYIRDIFAEAVDQDFLVKDPARKLKVPAQLRATDTTTLTWDQLRLALSKLSLRDRILLELSPCLQVISQLTRNMNQGQKRSTPSFPTDSTLPAGT
jgi:hypothetical protein